jgi:L-threonylcarbamoyladenylate synthase
MQEVVAALRRGEVIGIPTDTVYGLAALPAHEAQLFALKRRPAEVHVPLLVAAVEQAERVGELTSVARALIGEHWPGALTVVVSRQPGGAGQGTVGLRCPDHERVRALLRVVGPLSTTSANLHGEPPLTTAAAVSAAFPGIVVLDGGTCDGQPSTVVDCTGDEPVVLRPGAVAL